MRTSNKILLGGLLAALLTVIGIHVTLYAKIKSGDLVVLSNDAPPVPERVELGPVKQVEVKGFREFVIIPSDSPRIEFAKWGLGLFTIKNNGDHLVIDGKLSEAEYSADSRLYVPITLYLPNQTSINATNSAIYLRGGLDTARTFSQHIDLIHSELNLVPMHREDETNYWGNITVKGENESQINCFAKGNIKNMDVSLFQQSVIRDRGSKIEKLKLQIDSSSSADLHGNNLQLLKQQQ